MGTLIGSWLIDTQPRDLQFGSFRVDPALNLPFIFFLSESPGLIISPALLRLFHKPRRVKQRTPGRVFLKLPLIRPLGAIPLRLPDNASP